MDIPAPVLFVYSVLTLFGLLWLARGHSQRRQSSTWRALQSEFDLERQPEPVKDGAEPRLPLLIGRVQGIPIQIRGLPDAIQILATLPTSLPFSIVAESRPDWDPSRAEWNSTRSEENSTRPEEEQAWFEDSAISVEGSTRTLLSALDDSTSERLRDFIMKQRGRLESDRLVLSRAWADSTQAYSNAIVSVVQLAQALERQQPLDLDRLMHQFRRSKHESLRSLAFSGLMRAPLQQPLVQEALRSGLHDRSPQIRLQAAAHAGNDGLAIYTEFALSTGLPRDLVTSALFELSQRFEAHEIRPILEQAIQRHPTGPILHAVLQAMVEIEDRGFETLILDRFEAASHLEDALQLLRALGYLGTLSAVERLSSYLQSRWGSAPQALRDSRVRDGVRDAIRHIQSKLVGAEAGHLTLIEATDASGALSLAEEPGRLSLVPREPTKGTS